MRRAGKERVTSVGEEEGALVGGPIKERSIEYRDPQDGKGRARRQQKGRG